ncbi:hypothetical protein D9V84_08900 [Bacteroidetes/Chlorobi group bacterium Naka2016]|jgi:hypothetical protein|nr:MAG: hypothetical protein D9V84_08900 [Bacteroidetes/Chlorobi group bacterium Naka2016]
MKDIFSKVEVEDLTDDLKLVANACGIETARNLLRHCAGMSIYIPKIARLDKFIERYIKENSTKNFKIIANELGVTEQFIKKLFRQMRKK